jgi:nitroreductase
LWNAARRLACLVAFAFAPTLVLLVRDALEHRAALLADVAAASAAYLVAGALVALMRVRRFFSAEESPPIRSEPYRHHPRPETDDAREVDRARATRACAGALMALAVAAAFVIVAAAAR